MFYSAGQAAPQSTFHYLSIEGASRLTPGMQNLFLIGMMGSWKSTVGRKLALALKMEFIDTDDAIEVVTEMKISEIFREFGEKRFREMESAYFNEKAKQFGLVFSTGGGIVLDSINRKSLQNKGICFLLDASPKSLSQRIHNTTKRPLLTASDNLEAQLQKIWDERKDYYRESAHHIIDTNELQPEEVIAEIMKILEVQVANH